MAKILIAGNAIVITSARTLSEIETLEKYNPKALVLTEKDDDGNTNEVFKVGTNVEEGSISSYGVSFSDVARDGSNLACLTVEMPSYVSDPVGYVSDKYGVAVMNLNKVEEKFSSALAEVEAQKAQILSNIVIA